MCNVIAFVSGRTASNHSIGYLKNLFPEVPNTAREAFLKMFRNDRNSMGTFEEITTGLSASCRIAAECHEFVVFRSTTAMCARFVMWLSPQGDRVHMMRFAHQSPDWGIIDCHVQDRLMSVYLNHVTTDSDGNETYMKTILPIYREMVSTGRFQTFMKMFYKDKIRELTPQEVDKAFMNPKEVMVYHHTTANLYFVFNMLHIDKILLEPPSQHLTGYTLRQYEFLLQDILSHVFHTDGVRLVRDVECLLRHAYRNKHCGDVPGTFQYQGYGRMMTKHLNDRYGGSSFTYGTQTGYYHPDEAFVITGSQSGEEVDVVVYTDRVKIARRSHKNVVVGYVQQVCQSISNGEYDYSSRAAYRAFYNRVTKKGLKRTLERFGCPLAEKVSDDDKYTIILDETVRLVVTKDGIVRGGVQESTPNFVVKGLATSSGIILTGGDSESTKTEDSDEYRDFIVKLMNELGVNKGFMAASANVVNFIANYVATTRYPLEKVTQLIKLFSAELRKCPRDYFGIVHLKLLLVDKMLEE